MAKRIDWSKAKLFYFSGGEISYQDVAEEFGVGIATVKRHAGRGNWVKDRRKVLEGIEKEALKKQSEGILKARIETVKRNISGDSVPNCPTY